MGSRVTHHIDFPDYDDDELVAIAERMLERQEYRLAAGAEPVLREYVARRRAAPRFAQGRSIRNALDRARLRHASRLLGLGRAPTVEELATLEPEDILKSSVFADDADDRPA
jgi:hypothetical protein